MGFFLEKRNYGGRKTKIPSLHIADYASVAQLAERQFRKLEVVSSILTRGFYS
jgi:hypothetical protein